MTCASIRRVNFLAFPLSTAEGIPGMSDPSPDIHVMIPYKDLEELLKASRKVLNLERDMKRLALQQSALRLQFLELLEKFRELD